MLEWLNEIDTQLLLLINGWHSPFWDEVMYWTSKKTSWYPVYAVLLVYMFWRDRWWGFYTLLFVALVVTAADQSSVHLFKNMFERLRPSHNPELIDQLHFVRNYRAHKPFGFVSSHAANTFAIAMFLSFWRKNRGFTIGVFIWATVVSYTRVYLGVHYPGDILGGALLGSLIGLALGYIYIWSRQKFQHQTKTTTTNHG